MTSASDLLDAFLIDDHQNLTKYKKLPKRQIIELIEASLRKYTWLREHDAELPDAHVARLKKELGIARDQVMAIGDGANDLLMLEEAGTSIAYHAKPVVKAKTAYALDYVGLDGVLALFPT